MAEFVTQDGHDITIDIAAIIAVLSVENGCIVFLGNTNIALATDYQSIKELIKLKEYD